MNALDIKVYAKGTEDTETHGVIPLELPTIARTSGRTEHHGKLHVLISAEIREHKLAGQTLLLA